MTDKASFLSLIRGAEEHKECLDHPCIDDNLYCVAANLIDETICLSQKLIKEDPQRLLLYKRPMELVSDEVSYDSDETDEVNWVSIEFFSVSEVLLQIHDYIRQWELSPFTKFVVEPKGESIVPGLGKHYYVDALFSKPTPKCPNPLAIAVVHFALHVSNMLPHYYPIMVTYRFEGYKTTYYALGERCLYTMTFQRFYIDSILHMKLSFYAKICECAFPPEPPEPEPAVETRSIDQMANQDKESVEEELDENYGKLI